MKKIPITLVLFIFSCSSKNPIVENSPIKVEKITISSTDYTPEIQCFGNISFTKKTTITAPAEGVIDRVFKESGDAVYKNETILRLKNTQLEIEKRQIESEIESLETSLELSKAQLSDSKRNMEGKFLNIKKDYITLSQKEKELKLIQESLKQKEELFFIDGISKEEIKSLRLQVESKESELQGFKVDIEISMIGFRDEDILNKYGYIPPDPLEKHKLLIDINTQREDAEVKVATSKLNSAISQLESLNLLLSQLEIKSPYTGILGNRAVEEGERVKKSDPLVTTFTNSSVYSIFTVQENQVHNLNIGQEILVNIPSLGGTLHKFYINQISPIVDEKTGNVTIKGYSDNFNKQFIPGMFFTGKVITGSTEKRIQISEESIIKDGGNSYVFILKNSRVYKRKLELNEYKEGNFWVSDGLQIGDTIVNNPPNLLKDGMEVIL
ncbi:MAG: efflux RND transporter periplasmic adaptor subunit [Spirochaetales bacterium]|nr:efflux RND transporter periplasmic adaptor subunit [Spirochaetales bacterium]